MDEDARERARIRLMVGVVLVGLLIAGLVIAYSVRAEVIIEVRQEPVPIACPLPAPAVIRNEDGTYTRESVVTITLQMCYLTVGPRNELWTDYPERGGEFVRELPRDAQGAKLRLQQGVEGGAQ